MLYFLSVKFNFIEYSLQTVNFYGLSLDTRKCLSEKKSCEIENKN